MSRHERPECPLCGGCETQFACANRDRRRGIPGEWRYWECRTCRSLFQHPMPTFHELQGFYANYTHTDCIDRAPSRGTRWAALRRAYHVLTGDADPRDFVPARRGTRILDFGCGAAPYLNYFRSAGVDISGAEISPTLVAAHRAAGADVVLIESMERIPFANEEFDVVYLMQVIEHVLDPRELLAEVSRVLKRPGTLYLAMPNARSIWRRAFGARWVAGWFAPYHLFVYSMSGIRALAQATGFQVVRGWSVTPDSWLRLHLRATLRPGDNRLDARIPNWLDASLVRLPLALLLRAAELLVQERDCLVVELAKC